MDRKVGIFFMVLVAVLGRGWAADDTSCLNSLTPCSSYLNTTGKPDKACCDGLIEVIDKDAQCLCGLLKSDMVKQLGINITKAMELPGRCGKNVTADQCNKTTSSSSPPPKAAPTGGSSSSSSSTSGTKGVSNMASPGAVFSVVPMGVLMMVGALCHLLSGEFSTNLQFGMKPSLIS